MTADTLYFGASIYQVDNSRKAKKFAKREGQKGAIVSTTYDGTPAFVKDGRTYVFLCKNPRATGAGFDWVRRMKDV